MSLLNTINPHLLHYHTDCLAVDILGGVEASRIESMIVTLRITLGQVKGSAGKNYPPYRTTVDLYNDNQSDKLIRRLCDRWELPLIDVSSVIHKLTYELENYKLERLRYNNPQDRPAFEPGQKDKKEALKLLKSKTLLKQLTTKLNTVGIIGEDDTATVLFMAMSSYKFSNPFSVLCLAKSGIGKSYILQKLSECMPGGSYSFHTQISANALYYFSSDQLQNKALFIEDLEWTTAMLSPLSTLQSGGRLIKTRAVKNKDGMMHSSTFEVTAKLCLLGCAYSDRNYQGLSLPFLLLHLNHSTTQDIAIMEYQQRAAAGQVIPADIEKAQHELQCVIASLQNVSVINRYATLINLPEDVQHPRKSLLLLLNFIQVITYFFQYHRPQQVDKDTGELYIETHPNDIALAFRLLKNSLFRRADELSTTTRGFYNWLTGFLKQAKTDQFMALDIRKARSVHPRTLNRYLQELKLYSYIKVVGGNKHREGYRYRLTAMGSQTDMQKRIEKSLNKTLDTIYKKHEKGLTEASGITHEKEREVKG